MKHINNNKGGILSFVLVVFAVATTFGVALGSLGLVQNTMANREVKSEQAYLSAKSMSEFLVTNGTEIITELAKSGVGSTKTLIDSDDSDDSGYETFGKVEVVLTGKNDIDNPTEINIAVTAHKDGSSATIKSVWKKQATGSGLSFSGNFKIIDCKAEEDKSTDYCKLQTERPVEKEPKLVDSLSMKYVLDDYTAVDQNGELFYTSKVTESYLVNKLNEAWDNNKVEIVDDEGNDFNTCEAAKLFTENINPYTFIPGIFDGNAKVNYSSCSINLKNNRAPHYLASYQDYILIFDAAPESVLNVVVDLDKNSNYIDTWHEKLTFVVRGGGTVNFIVDYKDASGFDEISVPQISKSKTDTSTVANLFLTPRKNKPGTEAEKLIVNYGSKYLQYNSTLGYRDGSIHANIYMPKTNLDIIGYYPNLPSFFVSNPLFVGDVGTKNVRLIKATNVDAYGRHHTSFTTTVPWVIYSPTGDTPSQNGSYVFSVYAD